MLGDGQAGVRFQRRLEGNTFTAAAESHMSARSMSNALISVRGGGSTALGAPLSSLQRCTALIIHGEPKGIPT